jgi:ATP-binding cassette subfamily A (ABC1) protein 3
MINSLRNYLVLISALLPVFFVVISLIIDQQIPKPEDSPPLLMSLERYQKSNVPYTYSPDQSSAIDFIHSYESVLKHSPHIASVIDLTTNNTRVCQNGHPTDVITYLLCIGARSLLELNDQYVIGVDANENLNETVLDLTGYFNNQPYHAPPLSLNYITNSLLKQYSSTINRSIHVINHPVDKRIDSFDYLMEVCFFLV